MLWYSKTRAASWNRSFGECYRACKSEPCACNKHLRCIYQLARVAPVGPCVCGLELVEAESDTSCGVTYEWKELDEAG